MYCVGDTPEIKVVLIDSKHETYSTTHKVCVHRSNYTKSHLSAYVKLKTILANNSYKLRIV